MIILSSQHLRVMQLCERIAWLDRHGDPARRSAPPPDHDARLALGVRHEQHIHSATLGPLEQIPIASWEDGVRETRALMRQGAATIVGAHLELETPLDLSSRTFTIRGVVDQLLRLPDQDGCYAPVEIKQRAAPADADWLQLDLYVWLLSQLQGRAVPGELWLGADAYGQPRHRLPHAYDEDRLLDALTRAAHLLTDTPEPPVRLVPHCKVCHWRPHCQQAAEADQAIDLLYGVSRRTRQQLHAARLDTLAQVAACTPDELQAVKGIGPATAPAIRANAQAWLERRPVWFGALPPPCTQPGWMFDLETLEDGSPWSLGWCDGDGQTAIALVAPVAARLTVTLPDGQVVHIAPTPDDAWRAFAEAVSGDDAPVFHWTAFDSGVLKKTAPPDVIAPISPRMHDLHRSFVRSVSLPVRSTSIKVVSAYLGFTWLSSQDWFAALMDYQRWLADDSADALMRACAYQREDVQSMALVWRWLNDNRPAALP